MEEKTTELTACCCCCCCCSEIRFDKVDMEVVTMRKEGIRNVEVKVIPQEIIHKVEGKTRKELENIKVEVNLPYGL